MKRRIITTLLVFSLAVVTFLVWKHEGGSFIRRAAYAVGDLDILWGVPDGDPIFVVANMLPGDEESRTVEVHNSAASARPVAVRGVKTSELLNFAGILDFVISENATDLYGGASGTGPKTLQDFFDESVLPASIPLSTLGAGDTTQYVFTATFPASAGNEYQGAEVVFDIFFGIDSDIPAECSDIEFTGDPIFGTDDNDTIRGTHGNDLVFALEGDDYVTTFGGDDCIIGGAGKDELRGETGDDIIFGSEGDDLVVGAVGQDLLFGNDGNDTIRGENNDDIISGGAGHDLITGGNEQDSIHGDSGDDTIWGENGNDDLFGDDGNDTMDGGNGTDQIHGDNGNDTMNGKNGNDTIIGGADTDNANGSNGTDTCDAETEIQCEL